MFSDMESPESPAQEDLEIIMVMALLASGVERLFTIVSDRAARRLLASAGRGTLSILTAMPRA